MPHTNALNVMPADDLTALDAALADFDLGEETIIEPDLTGDTLEELTLADVTEASVIDDDTLMELDHKLGVQESYQNQPAGTSPEAAPKAAKPKKEKKASATPAPTRVPRDIASVPADFFVLTGDVSAMSDDDKEAAKLATLALKPSQKKVAEKFENLFAALSVGKQPSTYTMIAFNLLNTLGTMTSTDLVSTYKTTPTGKGDMMGEGTARSQAGQLMNLFAAVKIADRNGQTLVIRSDSLLAERLRNLPAAAE